MKNKNTVVHMVTSHQSSCHGNSLVFITASVVVMLMAAYLYISRARVPISPDVEDPLKRFLYLHVLEQCYSRVRTGYINVNLRKEG